MTTSQATLMIKNEAKRLGFDYCGVSKAGFLEEEAPRLENWLRKEMQGEMNYMNNYFDMRLDPRLLVPDAKSVISLLLNYYPAQVQADAKAPKISKYSYGKDYHFVIKEKLNDLDAIAARDWLCSRENTIINLRLDRLSRNRTTNPGPENDP